MFFQFEVLFAREMKIHLLKTNNFLQAEATLLATKLYEIILCLQKKTAFVKRNPKLIHKSFNFYVNVIRLIKYLKINLHQVLFKIFLNSLTIFEKSTNIFL